MREPVECYKQIKREFKEPQTHGQHGKLKYTYKEMQKLIYAWSSTNLFPLMVHIN